MSAYDRIPTELRERHQWVLWRFEERGGKRTKVPRAADGGPASATDPDTWATYEHTLAAVEPLGADGIGYVFSPDDPFAGIDLDAGLDEAERASIVARLRSYTERSVSGDGLHVIVRASLNGHDRHRSGPFEVYDAARYFVFTGEHVVGTPATIEERQDELDAVLAEYLPSPQVANALATSQPVDLDDRELLERAFTARNGDKFRRLWEGDVSGYPSQSEADLGLATMLAFWTGRNAGRMDSMFRSSGLMREKWERDDYRTTTIEAAIAGTNEVYEATKVKVRPSGDALGTHLAIRPEAGVESAGASLRPDVVGTQGRTHFSLRLWRFLNPLSSSSRRRRSRPYERHRPSHFSEMQRPQSSQPEARRSGTATVAPERRRSGSTRPYT